MKITDENIKWARSSVRQLSCLKNYGVTEEGWAALTRKLLSMSPSQEAGDWLISKVLDEEVELPSPARLREILGKKYKPDDEVNKGEGNAK